MSLYLKDYWLIVFAFVNNYIKMNRKEFMCIHMTELHLLGAFELRLVIVFLSDVLIGILIWKINPLSLRLEAKLYFCWKQSTLKKSVKIYRCIPYACFHTMQVYRVDCAYLCVSVFKLHNCLSSCKSPGIDFHYICTHLLRSSMSSVQ